MTIRLVTGTAGLAGAAPDIPPHDRCHIRAAAHHARRLYPGCVGELLHRELLAYADFGHRFDREALVPRLADEILARSIHPPGERQPGA
jgi:hypothetical protein